MCDWSIKEGACVALEGLGEAGGDFCDSGLGFCEGRNG